MSAPAVTLRIDTSGTAFGGVPTWTDRTSYLMAGSGYAASVTWGRQDERSDPDPATCSFYLKNDTGFWTPGNAAAPANWDIGCPVNLQITANGTTYDRFTGYVDAIEPTWPGGVQSWSVVKVSATDVLARLGLANGLNPLLQYEMLADSPSYLYPMNEAAGSSSAADVSSNGRAPAVKKDAAAGAWPLAFGQDMSAFEGFTGVNFGSYNTGYKASVLRVPVMPPTSGAMSFEMWFTAPDEAPSGASPQLFMVTDRTKSKLNTVFVNGGGAGTLAWLLNDGTSAVGPTTTDSVCDGGLHQLVCTLASDSKTARVYLDGVQVATATAGAALDFTGVAYNEIGGTTVPYSGGTWPKAIAFFACYTSQLSAARILAHYQAGAGSASERSDLRFARIAGYGGVTTSGLPTGTATMGGQRISGNPAIDGLRVVARSEGGPIYATKAGAVTFQARGARYNATATTIAASEVGVDLSVRRDRQGLTNSVTVSNQPGADQVVTDSASQTEFGRFDGGSFEVALASDDDALALGQWEVATGKNPQTRLPALNIDLYRNTSASFVASILALDISSKIQVTGLPSQAPSTTFTGFVEGASETISYAQWGVSFFTSPVTLEDSLLTLDDATKGQLDSSYVLGF